MSRVFQRNGSWWIDFKDARGVRHRKKVAPDKRIAKEVLDGILGNVARRQHLGVRTEESTLSDFEIEKSKRTVWRLASARADENNTGQDVYRGVRQRRTWVLIWARANRKVRTLKAASSETAQVRTAKLQGDEICHGTKELRGALTEEAKPTG
jgi:hypothetical protein